MPRSSSSSLVVGIRSLELHLSEARSLKEKRMVLNHLKHRVQRRYNVSVAEVAYPDLWQRSVLAVASVGSDRGAVERILEAVEREVERELPGEVLATDTEVLQYEVPGIG